MIEEERGTPAERIRGGFVTYLLLIRFYFSCT